jgi:putative endonuclease
MLGLFHNKKVPYSNIRGKKGEDIAEEFLRKAGYRILERNYVNKKGYRVGEIDIIAQDGDLLIFIEVKARKRKGKYDFPPEMAVDRNKFECLQKSAYRYVRQKQKETMPYRFDVVSIVYEPDETVTIKHLKNIFL